MSCTVTRAPTSWLLGRVVETIISGGIATTNATYAPAARLPAPRQSIAVGTGLAPPRVTDSLAPVLPVSAIQAGPARNVNSRHS